MSYNLFPYNARISILPTSASVLIGLRIIIKRAAKILMLVTPAAGRTEGGLL